MSEISYVGKASAETAREFEKRFQRLSVESGVIFVSVDAVPAPGGNSSHFEIRLGLSKNGYTKDIGWALIYKVFKKELELFPPVYQFTANIYLGYSGACHDEGPKELNSIAPTTNDPV